MKVNIGKYHKNNAPRTIKVQVDPWDTVSADYTLALVILPVLKQYKEKSGGYSFVDNEDVPEHMYIPDGEEHDDKHHELQVTRWGYVVDEMINAFDRIVDGEWEQDFHNGEVFDADGWKAESTRISNGLRLFGKYFQGLWT